MIAPIIARGIGFNLGSVKYIPTLGFGIGIAVQPKVGGTWVEPRRPAAWQEPRRPTVWQEPQRG